MSDLLFIAGSRQGMRTRSSTGLLMEAVEKRAPELRTELLDLARCDLEFFDGRDVDAYNADTRGAIDAVWRHGLWSWPLPCIRGRSRGA